MGHPITQSPGFLPPPSADEKPGPFNNAPTEITWLILDWLSLEDLASAQKVCRNWREVAGDLWNVPYPAPKTAFTIEHYRKYLGKKGITFEDKQPFTRNLYRIFKEKGCVGIPLLTQIPTINGEELTLNRLEQLFLTPNERAPIKLHMLDEFRRIYGNSSIKPGWVQLRPAVLMGTRSKPKFVQVKKVAEYAEITKKEYRLPQVAEAIICMGTRVLSTGKCEGYADSSRPTFTRCEGEITYQNELLTLSVGGASADKIFINVDSDDTFGNENIGATGALRTTRK